MRYIDLQSDTVTQPTEAMRQSMLHAEVGDDVYGEDPSINALEHKGAELLGKEAALSVPSGTMSNLLAMMSHCQRGEGAAKPGLSHLSLRGARIRRAGPGGSAVCSHAGRRYPGAQGCGPPSPPMTPTSSRPGWCALRTPTMAGASTAAALPARDARFLWMSTVCCRTWTAPVCSMRWWRAASRSRPSRLLFRQHLRLALSKGLGAPVGSLLVGSWLHRAGQTAAQDTGGGMRQAGILAQAALFALDQHVTRLADDHRRARRLAEGLASLPGVALNEEVQTNMVFLRLTQGIPPPCSAS